MDSGLIQAGATIGATLFAGWNSYLMYQLKKTDNRIDALQRAVDLTEGKAEERARKTETDLAAYKVHVAERYMTADDFIRVAADLKGDIREIRDLIRARPNKRES